jgi:hypothetical protein
VFKEDRMKAPRFRFLVGCLVVIPALADYSRAVADTVLIEATPNVTWRSGGMQSGADGTPLVVQAKAGDVLEIRLVGGQHGFVTLDKKGTDNPSIALNLVQACGETPQAKPAAVFRETECSQFNKRLGIMKLEVLDRFQSEVHFWCLIHQSAMWGTIKPGP